MGERPDTGAIAEFTLAEDDGKIQLHIVTNGAVLDVCTPVDSTTRPDCRLAFEVGVRADDSVLSDRNVFIEIHRVRVLECDPHRHPMAP